jgi:hypothetical protein
MNKFFTVFVALCLIGQSQAGNLRTGISGDLSPKHRRLSEEGQLNLSIDGRGYFQFRLRVAETDASEDESQKRIASGGGSYDQAYAAESKLVVDADIAVAAAGAGTIGIADNTNLALAVGDRISLDDGADTCVNNGVFTVRTATTAGATVATIDVDEATVADTAANCFVRITPNQNAGASAGSADGGSEAAVDGDASFFSQTVYSRDGSLHVNKYGYLVDDNGLLLVSDGVGTDANSKFHIHVPSRAEGVLVTPSGKVLAEELGGSVFTQVGQIKLSRFENPQGLNIRLKMKSNCAAANEDGFALGNWCAGTSLDGKDHTYLAETDVSGAGILGNPGDQGFGRIVQ